LNTQALLDYVLTVSASVAAEPSSQPILDAGLALQYLLPVVLREATRKVAKITPHFQSLVKPHPLTVNQNFTLLPGGLEEEFSNSFQVGLITPRLLRDVTGATWGIGSLVVKIGGGFTSLDIGRKVKLVDTAGTILTEDTILDVPNGDTLTLTNASGVPVACTIKIYDTQETLQTTFTDITCTAASVNFVVNSAEVLTAADVGKLIIIYNAGVEVFRSVVASFITPSNVFLARQSPSNIPNGTANLYRLATGSEALENYYTADRLGFFSLYQQYADYALATTDILPKFCVRDGKIFVKEANDVDIPDGTTIVVYGTTVPQLPSDAAAEIDAPEEVLDEVLLILSSVLRGETSLASLGLGDLVNAR
jgi:hypothetical protein